MNRGEMVEAAAGRFRKDLLYHLNVIGLTAPPLRLRGSEVARLADHYWPAVSATAACPTPRDYRAKYRTP